MNKKLKVDLWLIAVAVFALILHVAIPSAPVASSTNQVHQVVRAHGPAFKAATAASTVSSHPAASNGVIINGRAPPPALNSVTATAPAATTAPAAAAAPSATAAAPSATAAAPSTSAAASPATAPVTGYSQLVSRLQSDPKSVSLLVFQNGSNSVLVYFDHSSEQETIVVPDEGGKADLRKLAEQQHVSFQVTAQPPDYSFLYGILAIGGIFLLFQFISFFFSQKTMQGMMGNRTNPGASRGKDAKAEGTGVAKVTFEDVAGCDEAIQELKRITKAHIDRQVYSDFDAELPRGILLVGPPGNGKTLLAKAVANECDGTMDVLSGSDFVEMFVGVGASRVRDLFAKGRAKVKETGKPHVIFIDEIDAVGGKRGGNAAMKNDEREQTLNAMLVEMDGVQSNDGLIVIAATNRPDMLDEALLRPGRFDCQVSVDLPDKAGRVAIFAIHTRKKPVAAEVTRELLATRTYGYSGAEIKGAANRAAIIAAERWACEADALKKEGKSALEISKLTKREITLSDFDEGIDFVRYGGKKTGRQAAMSVAEKKNTAYHEGGHALAASVLEGCDPVVKVTIMSRSRALGYVQTLPNNDRVSFTLQQAVGKIIMSMAGRASQEVYLGTVDTGASNDFEQGCNMAYRMVTAWGMSRLGNISVGQREDAGRFGGGGNLPYGGELGNEIDREWRRIVDECYKIARYIVESDRERMEHVVGVLMDKETILKPEWQSMLETVPTKTDAEKLVFNPMSK